MAERTVAELVVERLAESSARFVFGVPGDSINPVVDAIRKQTGVRFVTVRHEEAGAFMASAYGKVTGGLGACLGTSGPGSIHLLNGLYDAKLDRSPVVALTGQVESGKVGTGYSQEVNLHGLFGDVAVYNQVISDPESAGEAAMVACRTALSRRGVSHLNLPVDISRAAVKDDGEAPTEEGQSPGPAFSQESVAEAVGFLGGAKRPVILAGRGARGCSEELLQLSKKIGAPIVTTFPAKGIFPDEPPNLGILGLFSSSIREVVARSDAVLMVGTSFPYADSMIPKGARVVQVDLDQGEIGKRVRADVGVVSDALPFVKALVQRAPAKEGAFLEEAGRATSTRASMIEEGCSDRSKPIRPYFLVRALERAVEDDCVLCVDSGAVTVFAASGFRCRGQSFVVSGRLGSMGFGMPAAIAAKLASPGRQVVAVVGDGGFAMTMGEFMTAAQLKVPITVVLFNNGSLGLVRFEQLMMGYQEHGTGLVNADFAQYASSCGGLGIRVEEPEELGGALERALSASVPSLVDVAVDPDQAPVVA